MQRTKTPVICFALAIAGCQLSEGGRPQIDEATRQQARDLAETTREELSEVGEAATETAEQALDKTATALDGTLTAAADQATRVAEQGAEAVEQGATRLAASTGQLADEAAAKAETAWDQGATAAQGHLAAARERAAETLDEARQVVVDEAADVELLARVKATLAIHLGNAGFEVKVRVGGGVVELTGQIATQRAKRSVLAAIEGLPGVRRIKDQTVVGGDPP